MAFDEKLAGRVRTVLARRRDVSEKRMFGGLAFLAGGHMFCGVNQADLVVRVGPQAWAKALARRHARPMDFTGKPLSGYVYVAPPGVRTAASLKAWVERGLEFARSLPPKA
jgi:TfoX/Sxy family transcriptional regulator of competence genes